MDSLFNITDNNVIQNNFLMVFNKLSEENIMKLMISAMTAVVICYVCSSGGEIEISHGETKVILRNRSNKVV